jgi:threonylcarbamoyladenosine tRNA methylthiotransferase MtaB
MLEPAFTADDAPRPKAGPKIVTFGCRLNAFESEVIRGHVKGRDDLLIVNTCAVTAEAERQARQTIRKLRRERPEAKLVVTGCAAQIAPQAFAAMPEVDRVIGNREKLRPETWGSGRSRIEVGDMTRGRDATGHAIDRLKARARAFLEVQQGCDHRCTFCIIPLGRGPSRSVPVAEAIAQAERLAEAGYRELVLTGVDLSHYGRDLSGRPTLADLVHALLGALPQLPRLRLSSLDPAEIDEALLDLFAHEERLMPHVHLSLQAGDDLILKRMKRRHGRQDAIRIVEALRSRRSDIALGADLIAGFPTEDEAMFERTLSLIEDCRLTFLHVFPFSPRPFTPAARMPQVPVAVRKERAKRLRAAGENAKQHWLRARLGAATEVLVEEPSLGRDPYFAPIDLDAEAVPGSLRKARIVALAEGRLQGRLA